MKGQGRTQAEELDQEDAASLAQSVHQDFVGLLAIFDRQLTSEVGPPGKNRSRIAGARAAAERGLRLTEELVQLLRDSR